MQFFQDDNSLPLADVQTLFPKEWDILKDHADKKWDFDIIGRRIKFRYENFNPIFIDIDSMLDYHKKFFFKNSIYKEPLGRAIGLKKGQPKPNVLDATAGMMHDSVLMYSMGLDSISLNERHPVIAALITNAISLVTMADNSDFKFNYLNSDLEKQNFDVIYFDPMYSEKNKKAAPKKEMIVFRDIVGEDLDCVSVAKKLKEQAKSRLVIKRSVKASPLIEGVSFSFQGKSTRYDVYLG